MSGGENMDRGKMMYYLVPAVGVAAVVLLVGLVIVASGSENRKMSDGSNGSADDPDLKEITVGVKYRDLKEGTGEPCPPGAEVKIHYTGWLTDGSVFDSTKEGKRAGSPAALQLRGLILGWQEGIPGMKPGGIRKLVISPEKGYGAHPSGKIPASSTLIFEVELLEFTPGAPPPRARRSPIPTDLSKLSDGTAPGTPDLALLPIGNNGLQFRDIKVGDGPVCPQGATVIMDYTGWLSTGGTPFDNSWKGEPLNMPLGKLIRGWQEGVPGMRVGGIRKLVIPPDLGYGDRPQSGIPANSTLVFEIELLGFR